MKVMSLRNRVSVDKETVSVDYLSIKFDNLKTYPHPAFVDTKMGTVLHGTSNSNFCLFPGQFLEKPIHPWILPGATSPATVVTTKYTDIVKLYKGDNIKRVFVDLIASRNPNILDISSDRKEYVDYLSREVSIMFGSTIDDNINLKNQLIDALHEEDFFAYVSSLGL